GRHRHRPPRPRSARARRPRRGSRRAPRRRWHNPASAAPSARSPAPRPAWRLRSAPSLLLQLSSPRSSSQIAFLAVWQRAARASIGLLLRRRAPTPRPFRLVQRHLLLAQLGPPLPFDHLQRIEDPPAYFGILQAPRLLPPDARRLAQPLHLVLVHVEQVDRIAHAHLRHRPQGDRPVPREQIARMLQQPRLDPRIADVDRLVPAPREA